MTVVERPTILSIDDRDAHVLELVRDLPLPTIKGNNQGLHPWIVENWDEAKAESCLRLSLNIKSFAFLSAVHTSPMPHVLRPDDLAFQVGIPNGKRSYTKQTRAALGLGRAMGPEYARRYLLSPTEMLTLYVAVMAVGIEVSKRKTPSQETTATA